MEPNVSYLAKEIREQIQLLAPSCSREGGSDSVSAKKREPRVHGGTRRPRGLIGSCLARVDSANSVGVTYIHADRADWSRRNPFTRGVDLAIEAGGQRRDILPRGLA